MSVTFHPATHHLVVTIDSPVFEAADATRLESDLISYSNEEIEFVDLDLTGVEQIDSTAIHTLVSLQTRLSPHHAPPTFAVSNPSPSVRQVIELLGANRIFQIADATLAS